MSDRRWIWFRNARFCPEPCCKVDMDGCRGQGPTSHPSCRVPRRHDLHQRLRRNGAKNRFVVYKSSKQEDSVFYSACHIDVGEAVLLATISSRSSACPGPKTGIPPARKPEARRANEQRIDSADHTSPTDMAAFGSIMKNRVRSMLRMGSSTCTANGNGNGNASGPPNGVPDASAVSCLFSRTDPAGALSRCGSGQALLSATLRRL